MDMISASILGLVQGLTEFLPVSSSGHLVIGQSLLGWQQPELFFDVCLHLGTFVAVVVVFRTEILELFRGALALAKRVLAKRRGVLQVEEKMVVLVVLGSIPTAIVGFMAKPLFERLFSSIQAVGVNLLITGTFLWLTRYVRRPTGREAGQTSWLQAVGIGLAQSLAIAPGISRSGATIAAGLFLGLDRDWAGRFSFLLFLPAVMGALLLELSEMHHIVIHWLPTISGAIIAGISGYAALRLLLAMVRKGSFYKFAPYCWTLGLACLTIL